MSQNYLARGFRPCGEEAQVTREIARRGLCMTVITYDNEGEVEHKGRRFRAVKTWKWLLGLLRRRAVRL